MMTRELLGWVAVLGAAALLAGCAATGPTRVAPVKPYRPVEERMTPRPGPARVGDALPEAGVPALTNGVLEAVTTEGRVLRGGDRVQITIHAPPEPVSFASVVDEQGNINLPLIGAYRVAGRTCAEAQRLIEKEYVDQKIYKTVTVIIVPPESEYAVTGEMVRPGPYPLTRNMTLLQALSRAGRYTDYADKHRVILRRNGQGITIDIDAIRDGKQKDIIIIPGDVIDVPRSPW